MKCLTESELKSQTWEKIADELRIELNSLRKKNDSINLDAVKTAELRGRIKELKRILSIGEDPPPKFRKASSG